MSSRSSVPDVRSRSIAIAVEGGGIDRIEVSDDGTVRLRLLGSCDGCPSSSVTLKLAVEGAIEAAAPEITGIEVEDAEPSSVETLIPVSSSSPARWPSRSSTPSA